MSPSVLSVYPHSRGEHILTQIAINPYTGLSPLAWGTRLLAFCGLSIARFIPTRVGNTLKDLSLNPMLSVYPHSRGEHS